MTTRHLILGAGPAGVVTAETLRALDAGAAITMLTAEPEPPYSRMAIPYLLCKDIDESGTYLRKRSGDKGDYYAEHDIDFRHGEVQGVDTVAREVRLADGSSHAYDRLLVATGSTPLTPPIPGIDQPGVAHCWTLEDARTIAAALRPGAPVVLIGAGFIGCIILEALVSAGARLTVIEMGERMVPRMLDETCGTLLQKWCEGKGITVHTGTVVSAVESAGRQLRVCMEGGAAVPAELVISATGVRANAAFLDDGTVELKDGAVAVDTHMAASAAGIYAAGDVACGKDFSDGGYHVQAIQPTAVEHARVAAHNMHRHGAVTHHGAVLMNVLATMGLISTSYGCWQGVEGGDSSQVVDAGRFRYLNLRFADDRLIGANSLGMTQHIGILRGLIRGRFRLGKWKTRLMENPMLLMEAYLANTQALNPGISSNVL